MSELDTLMISDCRPISKIVTKINKIQFISKFRYFKEKKTTKTSWVIFSYPFNHSKYLKGDTYKLLYLGAIVSTVECYVMMDTMENN